MELSKKNFLNLFFIRQSSPRQSKLRICTTMLDSSVGLPSGLMLIPIEPLSGVTLRGDSSGLYRLGLPRLWEPVGLDGSSNRLTNVWYLGSPVILSDRNFSSTDLA